MTPPDARKPEAIARERLDTLASSLRRAAEHPGDADSIHDLRVSIRRFKQMLRVFDGVFPHCGKMRRDLKGFMARCGEMRNCDVAGEVLAAAGVPADQALKRQLKQRRARAESELATLLEDWHVDAHMRRWSEWLKAKRGDPRPAHALPKLSHDLLHAGRAAAKTGAGYEKMHEFRLLVKRYRYTLELLGGKTGDPQLETLRGLQERLGAINDCVTTADLIHAMDLSAAAKGRITAALSRLLARRAAEFRELTHSKEDRMKICILRHAEAEPQGAGMADAARKLTPEGKRELRDVLRTAKDAGVEPEVILTSPWTRALETAHAAGEALSVEQMIETKALLPDVLPAQIWGEIRSLRPLKEIMVVGHEPHLSRFAAFLLEAPVAIDMKKAAIVRIDVQEREGPPRGVLKWMLTPKLASGK